MSTGGKNLFDEFSDYYPDGTDIEEVLEVLLEETIIEVTKYQSDIKYITLDTLISIYNHFKGFFDLNNIVATIIKLDKERGNIENE